MNEHSTDRQGDAARSTPKSGWWWKITALFLGAPPIAVYGAEDEVEQERAARAKD
ncbi:hypothetical protein J2X03_001480 [Microbacterium trichothecenolyticum]|uniref:hypothetical protein n=1 Tax=Microbacterium trichothecenolyticum TaxID=69370 RepID=UPI0028598983|nr:hypothetical protein [Microbacterium trichothecenolyticum]MDR7111616.1 hypothetical protein [Microbacterium trichothecenolyticum]